MDCTNIDGANGNEAPGWRNESSIRREIERAAFELRNYHALDATEAAVKACFEVLRRRGLITSQALELLQRDGDLTPLR